MIQNERQYRVTRGWIKKFREDLAELRAGPTPPGACGGIHPLLRQAQVDAQESQLQTFEEEVAEYDALRSGRQKVFVADSLSELPRALIKARIAAGLTQKQLGERVGVAEQQVQRYEAMEYQQASFGRLLEIADALRITFRAEMCLIAAEPLEIMIEGREAAVV